MCATQRNYEKWIWVELVGFDNSKDDLGVSAYLDVLGFEPNAICLFVSSPDFILLHPHPGTGDTLPVDCCAYAVHSFNPERTLQAWTQEQVRMLINELHRHGVEVYVSVMTWFTHNRFHDEWIDKHREVIAWENVGPEPSNNLNPLKRLKDGSYFEDFFLNQLRQVIRYYGFDGWHAADGWGPAMNNIYDADFSDDMVEQFTRARGVCLPAEFAGSNQEDRAFLKARADWIWRHKRVDWIEFYVERWHSFFKKIADGLHSDGKSVVVNSAMTRDPFEAIYRFGIDYKRLVDAGVDGFVVETGAAAQDLVSGDRNRHYDYTATLMLMKAYVPDTKLIFLHVIRDHCENFDCLSHMPTALEKEVYSLSNVYYLDGGRDLERCADGLMVCLGDGILSKEWQWLHSVWETGFSTDAESVDGPVVVWSDRALRNQLNDFIATRRWHTQKLLFNLMERGAPIQAAVRIESVGSVTNPVLLLNPAMFEDEEIALVFSTRDRPVIAVGGKTDSLPEPDFLFEDVVKPYPLSCFVYGADKLPEIDISDSVEDDLAADVMDVVDAHFFTNELAARRVSDGFLKSCAAVIASVARAARVDSGGDAVKVLMIQQKNGTHRLLLKNDRHHYCAVDTDVAATVESARSVTGFPYAPIRFEGSRLLGVTVPNTGAVILDVKTVRQQDQERMQP